MNRLLSSITAAAAVLATLDPTIAAANATEAPPDPMKLVDSLRPPAANPSFIFGDLRQRIKEGKAAFNFNLELGPAGDRLDSATVPLPEGRRKVTLGTLKVTSVSDGGGGPCLDITFVLTVLPKGVEASDDPMLAARPAPYAVGLGRRLTEGSKQQEDW